MICLARSSKHGGRKTAKENIFNSVLALYNENFEKQDRLCVVKVKFHVFTCSKNMNSALSSFSPALIYVSISLILANIQLR